MWGGEAGQLPKSTMRGPDDAVREENLPVFHQSHVLAGAAATDSSLVSVPSSSTAPYGKSLSNRPTFHAPIHLPHVSAVAVGQCQGEELVGACRGARERCRLPPKLRTWGSLTAILPWVSFLTLCFSSAFEEQHKSDALTNALKQASSPLVFF